MFRPIPAFIRFSSKRLLVFIRFMRLCNDGEISSSVVLVITTIKRRGEGGGGIPHKTAATKINTHASIASPVSTIPTLQNPPQPRLLIVVITKTTDDEISPSLHNRINLINTNILLDENLMMAGIRRKM